jgi:peptidoglycan/LPS O-acetylase OafA/YrhL
MAFGCLLALLIEDQQSAAFLKRWSWLGFVLGTGTYLFAWLHFHHIQFYPGGHTKLFDSMGYWIVALASAGLTAHLFLNPQGIASRIFSFGPLAFLGRISYGVYLYHILLRTLVLWILHTDSQREAFIFNFPLTLFVAWLSYKYYEQPIIAWGRRRADQLGKPSPTEVTLLPETIDAEPA